VDARDVIRRFSVPTVDYMMREKEETIRGQARDLALSICGLCPDGRERSLAVTRLEEAVMWAEAAIERGE
jgi:hypothetical protein